VSRDWLDEQMDAADYDHERREALHDEIEAQLADADEPTSLGDHPHSDPGDGREECDLCGKWIWPAIHSCKRVPVTEAAWRRWQERNPG
jgi:hypothetical protein